MYTNYSSFEDLTKAASKHLEDIGRSKQTVLIYKWIWGKIKVYMTNNHIDSFTSKTITDYLSITYGNKSISELTRHQKHCLRCAICLVQFSETNKMLEVVHPIVHLRSIKQRFPFAGAGMRRSFCLTACASYKLSKLRF